MTTLCILYYDVARCRDLMSEWTWVRFCIAGNHISFCLPNVVFVSLCGYFVVCVCVCVCVYVCVCTCVHECMLMCVCIHLYLFFSVCTCRLSLVNR